MKYLIILLGLFLFQSSTFAQSLDDVFKKADKAQSKTEKNVVGSVHSDMDKATISLKDKVAAGDDRVRTLNVESSVNSKQSPTWTITKQEDGGGLAHWYIKKYYLKCTGGRKSGETPTIHLLKSSGWYQEVYGPARKAFAEAAADGCS